VTQFSLFGAAVAEPTLHDLDGVLLAGGHWVRNDAGARLSVVVVDAWRADALAAEFAARSVGSPDARAAGQDGIGVRTAFAAALTPRAAAWTRGANEMPPAGLELTAGGLRLWAIAAGRPDEAGFLLGTASADDAVHRAGGAQLSRIGLAGVSIARGGGPGWRITSVRRLRRLVELLGEPPRGGASAWPRLG
jgi:hypothetical protein